jgi:hypothetical protein
MLRALRVLLLMALAFIALSLVIAAGSPETGPIEKAILLGAVIAVLAAGAPLRHIGAHP